MGAADDARLQNQAEELQSLAPELTPAYLPAAARFDLLDLAEKEGDQGCQALLEVLAAAGEDVEECGVCGEPGQFAIDPETEESESALLRATFSFHPDYARRLVVAKKCLFACGLCRQLRNSSSLIHEIATIRPDPEDSIAEGLLEHLALVNDVPNTSDDAGIYFAWGQEVLCRAYALRTASSALSGWTLANPDESAFQTGQPGAAAGLALQLLLPEVSPSERQQALEQALRLPHETIAHTPVENVADPYKSTADATPKKSGTKKKSKQKHGHDDGSDSSKSAGTLMGQQKLKQKRKKVAS